MNRVYKLKTYIINNTSKILRIYGKYLLVFFILFLICFITGIMTASKYVDDLTCKNLLNKHLYSFLLNDINFFSYFLSISIYCAIIWILAIILTRNNFFIILNFIVFMLISYIFGFDLCVICVCLGLSGVVIGILIYACVGIPLILLFMLYFSIVCKECRDNKRGCSRLSAKDKRYLFLILFILFLFLLLVWSILFSIIHIFVIVD